MNEQTLFAEALERTDPQDRAAFLDQACHGDPTLRARIERLLAQHEHAGDFLECAPPAPGPTVDEPVTEQPGTVLAGRYKLLEQIGEGGMGAVWMAQQTEPVKRVVAVKLIKAGMDSRQVLARFEAERQALALMDHPHIAKVLDGGVAADGRPFFVMELVKGAPITRYCDEHRLTPPQRFQLFVPVCQAIQHAHQKGIIHRDIKPSNVLIALYDDTPVPKVIDFGVAKATGQQLTEQTLHTGFGAVVGTVEYMSPEQAGFNQLDVDTRSDIYSLGVLLYELLTGSPPFTRKELEKAGVMEMLRVIREKEPSKPSTKLSTADGLPTLAANRGTEPAKLTKLVRGELDWIVMKALEKDRSRRYETANGFAMALQRYLADEPVLACPPSAGYRLRKFVRRNKGPVVASALVGLALAVGMIGTILGVMRAKSESAEKEQARLQAVENEGTARAAADAERQAKEAETAERKQAEAVVDLLASVFRGLDPKEEVDDLKGQLLRRLDEAATRLDEEYAGQPRVRARLRNALGSTHTGLGEYGKAVALLEQALEECRSYHGPVHPNTLRAIANLGTAYRLAGRPDKALPLIQEALEKTRAQVGPDHPDTLTGMSNLALGYRAAGDLRKALGVWDEALKKRRAQVGADHPDTLSLMHNLAEGYLEDGQHRIALGLHEEVLRRRQERLGPHHKDTLRSMNGLAGAYETTGQRRKAILLWEETLDKTKTKFGPDHPETLAVMHNLAKAYQNAGELHKVMPLLEQALERARGKLGPNHPGTLRTLNLMGAAHVGAGHPEKAVPLLEEALAQWKARFGPDHPEALKNMNALAATYFHLGQPDKMVALLEAALPLQQAKRGPNHPETLTTMDNLSVAYSEVARTDKALSLNTQALALRAAKYGPDHEATLASKTNLASLYQERGELDKALPLFEEVLAKQEKLRGPSHPLTMFSMVGLASAYQDAKRFADAVADEAAGRSCHVCLL
jgi:serine/threonine protein kinase/tetratricopeptide (TPR) repeat protein